MSGFLGGASRLRAMASGFGMVGKLEPLHIAGQANLESNGPWAYGVVGL